MLRKAISVLLLVGALFTVAPSAQAVQTMGNKVCVGAKTQSGGYVTVYDFNHSAILSRYACSTNYSIYNVQAFRVPSNWVAVSQWGWNYYPGVHTFKANFQTLTLTLIYKPGALPAV